MPDYNQQKFKKGIYLEFKDVKGEPFGEMHAYLVYRDGEGGEHVLRGGPTTFEGTDIPVPGFDDIKTQNRSLNESKDAYSDEDPMSDRLIRRLPIDDDELEGTWEVMSKEVNRIGDAGIDYDLVGRGQNSNSVVAAAMHKVGMNLHNHLPDEVKERGTLGSKGVYGSKNKLQPGETNEDREPKGIPFLDDELRMLIGGEAENEVSDNIPTSDSDDEFPSGPAANSRVDEDAIRKLGTSLTQPGDAVDEALLKDDLTEEEKVGLMKSRAYLSSSDPRHKQVQARVAEWHVDRYGREPAKTDVTGRIAMDEKPKIIAPSRPDHPVEYPTGRPLDEAVAEISRTIMAQSRKTSPGDAVKSLQSVLNKQDDPEVRPLPMLKEDGVVGPKTRRALRFATQQAGADNLLSGLRRMFS